MSNQVRSYQNVIDVVGREDFQNYGNIKQLLLQIAKTNPQVVVDAHNSLNGSQPGVVTGEVIDYLLKGQKIMAIKQHRQDTGLGLKEAKDAIFDLIDRDIGLRRVFRQGV